MDYAFRQLPRNRWSPGFNESDFLGLGIDEMQLEDLKDRPIVPVDGVAASYALRDGRPLASVLPLRTSPDAVVEFVHSPQMYGNGIEVSVRYQIDLRSKLLKRHGHDVFAPRRSNHLNVCIHIRQGDCTWVYSGGRYVFVGKPKITADPKDVDVRRAPPVAAYCALLDALVSRIGAISFSMEVYSDGPFTIYNKAASTLGRVLYALARRDGRWIQWLKLEQAGSPLRRLYNPMCDPEVASEYESTVTALDRLCGRYPNATLFVGNNEVLTASAIIAFASADIVVLARKPPVFPLLVPGEPQNQVVLRLSATLDENMTCLDRFLVHSARSHGFSKSDT